MTYSLGIDLGTTYTAAALARRGRAEVVTLGYRATSIPTVVALGDDGTFLVGDAAERRGASQPERLAREFKRRVGDPTPMMLGGTPFSIDRLLAEVVRVVARTVVEVEGGPPASTVVTHPANWGPFKREFLEHALRMAGLEHATLLPEPVAAATWYASTERVAPGSTVAVYDLGGGTFDAALLQMGPDGAFAVRGRPEGVERLGGVDVDAAVLDHVLRTFGAAATTLDPEDPGTMLALARLRHDCVEAKEALSTETAVTIHAALPIGRTEVLLQRRELEHLIAPLFGPTIDALQRTVDSAGLGPGHPHAVLLVGGSSRMPFVGREVGAALGRPVAVDAHPKHPVALGAALVAAGRVADRPAPVHPAPVPAGRVADRPPPSPAGFAPPAVVQPGPAAFAAAGYAAAPAPPAPTHSPPPPSGEWGAPPAPPGWSPGPGPGLGPGGPPPAGQGRTGRRALVVAAILAVLALVAGPFILRAASSDDGDPGLEADSGDTSDATGAGTGAPAGASGDAGDAPADGPVKAWDYEVGEETIGTPAVDAQRAYVVDAIGRVTALNLADGTVAWIKEMGGDGAGQTPVVAGDVVIASTTEPYQVQGFDAATGTVKWTVPEVWAIDPPVVVGDTVLVSMGYRVAAIGVADGAVRWDVEFEDDNLGVWSGPLVSGDLLIAGSSYGYVFAMEVATGNIRWQTQVPRGEKTLWGIEVVGDMVITYDDDSFVSGMPVATGASPWAIDAKGIHPGSIATLGTGAAVQVEPQDLLLLDPATGAERGRLAGAGSHAMLNLFDAGLLITAGPDSLTALDAEGNVVWSTAVPFLPYDMAAGPSHLVATDYEGNVAAYPLT